MCGWVGGCVFLIVLHRPLLIILEFYIIGQGSDFAYPAIFHFPFSVTVSVFVRGGVVCLPTVHRRAELSASFTRPTAPHLQKDK